MYRRNSTLEWMSRLKGVVAKINWAKDHLDKLDSEMIAFLKTPCTVKRKDKPQDHRHHVRFEFKPIPIEIPLIAGDFCYCLRSGLDQLSWQLARINKIARPRTQTSFPIFSVRPPKGFQDRTKDLAAAMVKVIEGLQPYQLGPDFKTHPLWLLNELCNIDKHAIFAVRSTMGTVRFPNVELLYQREFAYGFEVAVSLSEKLNAKYELQNVDIVFGKPESVHGEEFEVRLDGLHGIYDFVHDDVLSRFAEFFG